MRLTDNYEELNSEYCQKIKEILYLLNELLSEKERSTIQLERSMELFQIFPLSRTSSPNGSTSIEENLKLCLNELNDHRKQYHQACEKERLKKRLEEFKGIANTRKEGIIMTKNDQQIGMEMLALVDPKKAAKIKFHRQQKEARKKRMQSIKERNKMYRLIASDEISTLFFKQAKKVDEDSGLEWGDEKLLEVEDPFEMRNKKKKKGKDMDEGGEEEGEDDGADDENNENDQKSEASDDSFASKLKKVKHVVDTSLATVQFEPNKPVFSPKKENEEDKAKEEDDDDKVDSKSEVSTISETLPPVNYMNQLSDPTKALRRESRIMSWLMRNRGGAGGGGDG